MSTHEDEDEDATINSTALEELQVLTAIFGEDLTQHEQHSYKILLHPISPKDQQNYVQVALHFAFTQDYPNTPPTLRIERLKGLTPSQAERLQSTLEEKVMIRPESLTDRLKNC